MSEARSKHKLGAKYKQVVSLWLMMKPSHLADSMNSIVYTVQGARIHPASCERHNARVGVYALFSSNTM